MDQLAHMNFGDLQRGYLEAGDRWCKHNVFTRSSALQEQLIVECQNLLLEIKAYKRAAQSKNNDEIANKCLHMQCMTNSIKSSLGMWVALKSKKFAESWSLLVDSQEYVGIARQIEDYEGARLLSERLRCVERSVFPAWSLYSSPGFTETIGDCSVCGHSFNGCQHIEGHIYCGRYCRRVNRKIIDVDHSALVTEPRDRRCIINSLSDDDGDMISNFTYEKTGKKSDGSGIATIETTIMSFSTLDLD